MAYREKSIQSCLAYLNKIYSIVKDGDWHNSKLIFGLHKIDSTNKNGYTIIPYWKKFKLSVRIPQHLFVDLGLMEMKTENNVDYYRWINNKPSKKMVNLFLDGAYVIKNASKSNDEQHEALENFENTYDVVEKTKMLNETNKFKVIENYLSTIDLHVSQLHNEVIKYKTDFNEIKKENNSLKELLIKMLNNNSEVIDSLRVIHNRLVTVENQNSENHDLNRGVKQLISINDKAREKSFILFKKQMSDIITTILSFKPYLNDINTNTKTTQNELMKYLNTEKLVDELREILLKENVKKEE